MTNNTQNHTHINPTEVIRDVKVNTTEKVDEIAQSVVNDTAQIKEQTAEVVKEVVKETGQHLEQSTNKTLEFLGFSVDIQTLLDSLVDFGVQFALALLVFFVGKWFGSHLVNVAKRIMKRSRVDETVANFVGNVLYGLMLVAVIVAALNKVGINTNSFVAILGAAAVAVGVSLKDQLSNLAAGVMIVIFRPFNRGDTVEVGGKLGTVMNITLVNTRIRTADNHEIIIPNGDIMTTASVNYSSLPTRRLAITVGIGYDSDIRTAREIMLKLAAAHTLTLDSPDPLVRVTALGDNAVDMTLYVWSENSDWWGVQCDLLEEIKYAFDDAGVNIPYPQRSVHIENLPQDLLDGLSNKGDKENATLDNANLKDKSNNHPHSNKGNLNIDNNITK